ncbi:Ig-like domain-containing protein [Saccharobesus litoralis]|nr:hypothetical protein [Saccharobesus litoralis]
MRLIQSLILFTFALFLVACGGGHSGDNSDATSSQNNYTLTIQVTSDSCSSNCSSFAIGETLTARVRLTLNGVQQAGQTVVFSATNATASDESTTTGSDGRAAITFTNSDSPGNASITASFGDLNVSHDFVFTSNNNSVSNNRLTTLTLTSDNCDGQTNKCVSFTQNTDIVVTATLQDSTGVAIAGELINFSAALGEFNVSQKLTNANGQAIVTLSNPNNLLGAAQITASYTGQEQSQSSLTENYEFVFSDTSATETLNVELEFVDGIRFQVGQQVTLSASVTQGELTPANQLVTFSVSQGALNSTTALTNENGIAQVTFTPVAADIGAHLASVSTTVNNLTASHSKLYEVQASTTVAEDIVIGYFDSNGDFQLNKIGIQGATPDADVTLAAGATTSLSVSLAKENTNGGYDAYTEPATISFSSLCVEATKATIDQSVNTVAGRATSTYENTSCSGTIANTDTLTASVTINNQVTTLTREISLESTSIGSLSFISASPTSLVLAGTGGTNQNETSTLTFQVLDSLGNAIPQLDVSFALATNLGGVSIFPTNSVTNSQGFVTTQVSSGNIPTSVVIEATATLNNKTVKTQSSELTVTTGLADQDSFIIFADVINSESFNQLDTLVTLTAYLSDASQGAVPDGTSVTWRAEGGQLIENQCTTTNGACSVQWRGGSPIPDNHRVTILATAIGHESFTDINSNGQYDEADGEPFDDGDGAGYRYFGATGGNGEQDDAGSDYDDNGITEDPYTDRDGNGVFDGPGFIDLPEAWLDANEDNKRNANEIYSDFDGDNSFSLGDGKFNGPQCSGDDSICAEKNRVELRASTVLISSSSNIISSLTRTDITPNINLSTGDSISLGLNQAATLQFSFSDTGRQIPPSNTQVSFTATAGDLSTSGVIIPNSSGNVDSNLDWLDGEISFTIANDLVATDDPISGVLTIAVTTPLGFTTTTSIGINLGNN